MQKQYDNPISDNRINFLEILIKKHLIKIQTDFFFVSKNTEILSNEYLREYTYPEKLSSVRSLKLCYINLIQDPIRGYDHTSSSNNL